MSLHTPGLEHRHSGLPALSSRYVNCEELPWTSTPFPGVSMKVLVQDPDTGLQTVLTRMEPGAVLPDHEHVGLEQSWVIEGRLVDHEGEVSAGQFVWRPAGSRHTAHAPDGALVLGIFHQPNRFFG